MSENTDPDGETRPENESERLVRLNQQIQEAQKQPFTPENVRQLAELIRERDQRGTEGGSASP